MKINRTIRQLGNMIFFLLLLSAFKIVNIHDYMRETDLDPIAFQITSGKREVKVGEEFEVKVIAVKRQNWDSRFGHSAFSSDFRLKVVFPEGFEQTGGTYSDLIDENLVGQKKSVEYTIKGRFLKKVSSAIFILLRGTKQSVAANRYVFRGQWKINVIDDNSKYSNFQSLRVESSITCSGYTFSEGQVVGTTSSNVTIHIENGCAVAYWSNGNRTHIDWLPLLNGKVIPDDILRSCVKWDGQPLDCVGCIALPNAPTISKTSGTTVCSMTSQSVTLTASGCSGTVSWFKDGVQVGTGPSITRMDAGVYTAKCTVGACVSNISAPISVEQTSGCGANSISCSGYTFSEGQVIGTTSSNVTIHIENGCAVAYWPNGNRTNVDWLPLLNGKTIPDDILRSCVKWDGQPLDCVGCIALPNAPTISKTSGTTVCSMTSQSVTLTASGCSGTVSWFKDGVQVGTGPSITRMDAGVYTAKCTVGACVSNISAPISVEQTSGCGANSISCSGYTFSEGQVIGTTSSNVTIHIENGCAVAYWPNGNRTNVDWLPLLNGKTIPDDILRSCVKWDGQPLDCVGCIALPNAPTISKTSGTTVCSMTSQSVTLTASGCSGTVSWFKDGVQVGTGPSITRMDAGVYTAKCTVNSCTSLSTNSITISQTSGCGVNMASPLGAYSTTIGGREFTYNKTPEFQLQFNSDGTISDITPGISFDGMTNKLSNNRIYYMIGYKVFENADGSYNRLQNIYLPDGIYTIRQFVCNENAMPEFNNFKKGLSGWNNGVSISNSRLSEIFLTIKTVGAPPSLSITPNWLKVNRNFLFPTFAQTKDWSLYNKFFCLVYQNAEGSAAAYQSLGINTDMDYNNFVAQPNTWNTVRWYNNMPSTMTNQALYDYGSHWIERSGNSKRFLLTDEIPENAQGQDPTIGARMYHFYKGAYDRLVANAGVTSKRQTGLYGSYGWDNVSGLINTNMLNEGRAIFEQSLTTHVHKNFDPATRVWAGEVDYYQSGQINVRNINHSYYFRNNAYYVPYEIVYVNERIKIGSKTYHDLDREADWITFSWHKIEPEVGLQDQNGNRIGIEYGSTGEVIPFQNGEVLCKDNLEIPAPWDEYVNMAFWSTIVGKGVVLWNGGGKFGSDPTKFSSSRLNQGQPIYWTSRGGSQESYVSGQNGAPVADVSGLESRLWASPGDAAYAGMEAAWNIRDRITTLSHASYSSSRGSFIAKPGSAGLHLNGFGVLNNNLFVIKDAYDAKKGLALVGTGSGGGVIIYYNGFLAPHEYEDNLTINGQNLGRVYGRQTVVKIY